MKNTHLSITKEPFLCYNKLFLNDQRKVQEYLVMSIFFRTFVPVPESTINTIYSPSKTHRSYEQDMENDSSSD